MPRFELELVRLCRQSSLASHIQGAPDCQRSLSRIFEGADHRSHSLHPAGECFDHPSQKHNYQPLSQSHTLETIPSYYNAENRGPNGVFVSEEISHVGGPPSRYLSRESEPPDFAARGWNYPLDLRVRVKDLERVNDQELERGINCQLDVREGIDIPNNRSDLNNVRSDHLLNVNTNPKLS